MENQAEDEFENRGSKGVNKVQMVKKCHMRISIKQALSHAKRQEVLRSSHQTQATVEQRVHDNGVEMVTTKQDGDEDSFESTEVLASKATESCNEVQKVSEGTHSQNHRQKYRAKSRTQHKVRNQDRRERRTNNPESLR